MPISAENKARYPKDWPSISKRIRERDGHVCKWCKAPNGKMISRGQGSCAGKYMVGDDGAVHSETDGEFFGHCRGSEWSGAVPIVVVLTCAHLDHQPENCADDNLVALCQKCHLRYDHAHHQANAAKTRRGRKAVGDLFK